MTTNIFLVDLTDTKKTLETVPPKNGANSAAMTEIYPLPNFEPPLTGAEILKKSHG